MSERPSTSLRNQRKHFVKCVDCSSQMLPRNAPKEASWTAAATLYLSGRINDGALCFRCANRRRELLGLPVEKEPDDTLKIDRGYADFATASQATLKKISINEREYTWVVGNLDSVVAKWSEQQFYKKVQESRSWLVAYHREQQTHSRNAVGLCASLGWGRDLHRTGPRTLSLG